MLTASAHHKHWGRRTFRFSLRSFRIDRNFSVRRFSIAEAAFLLMTAYLASKGLGVIRQVLFNSLFGTGPDATAYYAAIRLPDTIFNLIAGGALTHAFIPVFLSYEKKYGEREVWRLTSLTFNVLLVSLTVFVLVAEFVAPAFVNSVLVPGLPPHERDLTTALTRVMLLQPLILGLGTIATAILNSRRQFFLSALSIAISEFGLIGGLLCSRAVPGVGIYGPTFGLLASAVCQVAVQIPGVMKQGARYTFTWELKHPGLREILRLLGPNVLNVGVGSASAIMVTFFASYFSDQSSLAALHNAFALFTIPLTLVAQILAIAYLPRITTQATYGRYVRMRWTVLKIVGGSALFSVLAAIALYVSGRPVIHILFQHGAFDEHASTLTNLALIGYAVGLPGQTVILLIITSFYAMKDARTPLFANLGALAAQMGLSFFLLKMLKGNDAILALPLAASLTGIAEAILLYLLLSARLSVKVKTDGCLQRLQRRRMYVQALQESGRTQQPMAQYQPIPMPGYRQLVVEYSPLVGYQHPVVEYSPVQGYPLQEPQPVVGSRLIAPKPPSLAQYQRMVLLDPGNLNTLLRWHIAMLTNPGTELAAILEVLTRVCRRLRSGEQLNYERVVDEYDQAAKTHPDNATVHFALGQICEQLGNYDKAIAAYMSAMHDSTVEVMARVSAAQCLLALSEPEVAIEQLEQALQSVSPGSIDPSIWTARPHDEGEEHLAPEVEITRLLAEAYDHSARQEQTQTISPQVEHATPYQDEGSSPLGAISTHQENVVQDYRSQDQTESALDTLTRIVRLAPPDPCSHDELADSYLKRGLLDAAIAELRVLADIYLRRSQLQQAGATLRRIGNIHAEVGDMEEALTYLRRAIELAPDDIDLLREMVGFCLQLGHATDAAQYQTVIVHHYLDMHQVKESVAALQQLIAIDRSNYEAYDLLGQMYQSVGEYEQARRVYSRLARIQPESSIAQERLATLQGL